MKQYIHYGSKEFTREAFQPVKNRKFSNKPFGGLWVSDPEAEFGWKEWNDQEEFMVCDPDNAFTVGIADDAMIFRIDSKDSCSALWSKYRVPDGMFGMMDGLDFERMLRDGIDCIDFRISEEPSLYNSLYGWDCDSVLILNPDVIRT